MTDPSNYPIPTGSDPATRIRAYRESMASKAARLAPRKTDHNGRPVPAPAPGEHDQEDEQESAPRFHGTADQGSANRDRVHVPSALEAAEARGDWATARRIKAEILTSAGQEMNR